MRVGNIAANLVAKVNDAEADEGRPPWAMEVFVGGASRVIC
jgi:hypothetical protein